MSTNTTTPPDNVQIAKDLFLAVELKVSFIGTSVKDKVITAEVADDKQMQKGQGRYTKTIFKEPLANFMSWRNKASAYLRDMTFEGIGSQRLLAVAELSKFQEKMDFYRAKMDEEVSAFIANYDAHIEAEKSLKGLAFKAKDYPVKAALAAAFDFNLSVCPVGDPSQFETNENLSPQQKAALKAKHKSQIFAAVDKSRDEVTKTLVKLISEVATVLADPSAPLVDHENKKGPVPKLAEYLERVPALNVTNDPEIKALVEQCRGTLILATQTLKNSPTLRSKTSAEASAILQQFNAGYGRKLSA